VLSADGNGCVPSRRLSRKCRRAKRATQAGEHGRTPGSILRVLTSFKNLGSFCQTEPMIVFKIYLSSDVIGPIVLDDRFGRGGEETRRQRGIAAMGGTCFRLQICQYVRAHGDSGGVRGRLGHALQDGLIEQRLFDPFGVKFNGEHLAAQRTDVRFHEVGAALDRIAHAAQWLDHILVPGPHDVLEKSDLLGGQDASVRGTEPRAEQQHVDVDVQIALQRKTFRGDARRRINV
jgi:hypothetical protein